MHPDRAPQSHMPAGQSTNPYDFILNESPKPKRSWLPKGNSKGQRIAIIAIIVAVIFLLGIVLFAMFNASSNAGSNDMISAAQQQQEIARIADTANTKARSIETKNIAILTAENMRSDQVTLTAYLKKNRVKVSSKELNATKNTQTDTALTQAGQVNAYDAALINTLAKELSDYRATLKQAHDHTSSASAKKMLEQMYNNAALIGVKLQSLNSTN